MHDFDTELGMSSKAHRVKPSGRLWNPSADVYRSRDGWIVKLDLAGICSDDLEIEIQESTLHIRGCRKDTFYRDGFICHQMEITYSRFEKIIEFPAALDGLSLAHDYRDGFLIVMLRSE